jgi:hypothetical protein
MSAEERITKIENLLLALTESQVNAELRQTQTDKEMAELRQLNKASNERLDRHIEVVAAAITKTAAAQEVTEEQLQKLIS